MTLVRTRWSSHAGTLAIASRPLALTVLFFALALAISPLAAQNVPGGRPFKQDVVARHSDAPSPSDEQLQNAATNFLRWKESNAVVAKYHDLGRLRGLTISQILAYGAEKDRNPELRVTWDETGSVPIQIEGGTLEPAHATAIGGRDDDATARRFFERFKSILRINNPDEEYRITGTVHSGDGRRHARYRQTVDGIDVWGKEIIVHYDTFGNIDLFTGRYVPTPRLTDAGGLPVNDAIAAALREVGPVSQFDSQTRSLLAYEGPAAYRAILIDNPDDPARPVHVVEIRPNIVDLWRVFVDARDGSIVRKYNATCSDGPAKAQATDLLGVSRTIDTYLHQGTYFLIDASRPMYNAGASTLPSNPVGAILTVDARNTDLQSMFHVTSANNTWPAASSVSAHYNAAVTYEYYRQTHNRNAIDNRGSTIISVVNVTSNGQSMINAFWNGKVMAYGNGGNGFKSFAGALDVAAHEMTHGVTENTAGLEYRNQSGALNESLSDIFGVLVERVNWKLGEDLVTQGAEFPNGAMRDLSDPHNGATQGMDAWQPAHMNEFVNLPESDDNGGVHTNSGIPNRAAYLIAGGPLGVGKADAEKIFYCALTTKLTKQSRFVDFRLAVVRCAEELFGAAASQVLACRTAFDAVGITDGTPTKDPNDLPQVNGPDKILFVDVDPSVSTTLYMATPPATSGNDFNALSNTPVARRPSVSDDGSVAVFIDGDSKLRAIDLNPATPNERPLDDTPIWGSVALSRDQNLIALTTNTREKKIHVFDISGAAPVLKSFDLYTPSYSDDEVPNVAEYADAMDFSADGKTLLFDLYNEMSVNGAAIGFWDVNLLDVWDPAGDTFGSGRIQRMFPQQTNVDIGNPTYAKNKTTVFAFDKQIPAASASYIMAVNMTNGDAKQIAQIPFGDPGFPSYRGDDRVISFGAPASGTGTSAIFNVPVETDAVTASGQPAGFITFAKYPVWFRIGTRPPVSSTDGGSAAPVSIELAQNYPNPFNPSTTVSFTLTEAADIRLAVTDALGRTVQMLASGRYPAGTHQARWDGRHQNGSPLPSGAYTATLLSGNRAVQRQMLLVR